MEKVIAALNAARTELANSVTADRKLLADPKVSVADAGKAGDALRVAGIIDTALEKLVNDIPETVKAGKAVGSLKSLTKARKPKKSKKADAAAPAAEGGKKK